MLLLYDITVRPIRCFSGKRCYIPNDLYQILIQSRVDYEKQHETEQRFEENCRQNGLELHGLTPHNGDCFFEAIASQLRRIGVHQTSSAVLRWKVTYYICNHLTYEVSINHFLDIIWFNEFLFNILSPHYVK